MSILQEARQLSKELHQCDDWHENSHYFLEKCDKMLPELLTYAEQREAQAIDERCRYTAIDRARSQGKLTYKQLGSVSLSSDRAQAAKELDADLPSWHKITDEEREAIQDAILCFKAYERDEKETIEVLRGMI